MSEPTRVSTDPRDDEPCDHCKGKGFGAYLSDASGLDDHCPVCAGTGKRGGAKEPEIEVREEPDGWWWRRWELADGRAGWALWRTPSTVRQVDSVSIIEEGGPSSRYRIAFGALSAFHSDESPEELIRRLRDEASDAREITRLRAKAALLDELVCSDAMDLVDELRSYTREWDWKHGEGWDLEIHALRALLARAADQLVVLTTEQSAGNTTAQDSES